jgi:extracellular elastinolytic metalloproteinase
MKVPVLSRVCLLFVSCIILQFVSNDSIAQSDSQEARSIIETYLRPDTLKPNTSIKGAVEWEFSDTHFDKAAGLSFAYIQQTHQGIPLFNAISVFAIKDGKVVHGQPNLTSDVSVRVGSVTPNLSPENAIHAALLHLKRPDNNRLSVIKGSKKNHFLFEASDISASPIDVHLIIVPTNEELKLAWNVSIEMKDEPHWWNIRIDANTGEYLDKNDFTVQCNFSEDEFHKHSISEVSACSTELPHTPQAAAPPSLTYNVYPLPVEAPTFGIRSILTDPADYTASPFGWHDTDGSSGAEYTTTRGNNAYTYDDADNDNLPGYSPDGGASLNFDFLIIPSVAPIVNKDAALTNMFVQTNVVHDALYHLGFDEAAGNFQENNYGNGGAENDVILAEGFDGSGMNNANFTTPPDGSSPRMQMYLWNSVPSGCTSLDITSSSYTGPMDVGTAEFTASGSVTADLILADDSIGTISDACDDIVNDVTGKIVVIDRGGCSFVIKAQKAEAAGAVGVIIVNNQTGPATNMSGSPVVGIPCLSISQADGDILKSAILSGTVQGSLATCAAETFDSNFDNGIIVHEYGHGVSSRLTGGPSQASCLTNEEQANEGWSDWLALMLTIEPGDAGEDARGMGSYVLNQLSTGGGIRRFPYSTDMVVNPQTYGDLATSEGLHDKGEIWCDAIWDMSWLLMDQFGFDSDPMVEAAGNNIAIRLVLTGLKLQPCSPGFLDSRDGVLAADALLYSGEHQELIWQAFARRGMGCSANQGSANAIGDETEAFDEPDSYYLDSDEDGFGDAANMQVACSQPSAYVTNSDDCDDGNNQVGPCIMWTGTTSTDWNASTNWSGNAVPLFNDTVVISSAPANQPQVTSSSVSPAVCAFLSIQSGASLTINAGKALTVSGNTDNEGAILIKSDATGIGSLITNGAISGAGASKMEQYLTGSGGATPDGLFFYVSSPVTANHMYDYNVASGDKLWAAIESTQSYVQQVVGAVSMTPMVGYVARMGSTQTITFNESGSNYHFNTGALTTGSTLTRTGTSELKRGYNLVGNPYPSTVSWDDATKTNLETTMWYRTHQGSTMLFDAYNATGGVGTNNNGNGAVTGDVPPTQAFWVRVDADGNTGQLDFTNAMRSHGTLTGIYRMAAEEGTVRISLSDGSVSDEQIIMFNQSALDGYDDYDSYKFWSSDVPQLYSTVATDTLTINGLNNPTSTPTVDLGMKIAVQGEHTINATSITFTETQVYLEDKALNVLQNLNTNPVYDFTSDAGNIGDRFVLHFNMSVTDIQEATEFNSKVYASNKQLNILLGKDIESGSVQVLDMAGRTVRTFNVNATSTSTEMNVNVGVYLVRVETDKGTDMHKVILK